MTALVGVWAELGKWRWPLVIGLLAAALLTLTYCQGQRAGGTGEKLKQAEAAAKLDATADAADAKAADARVTAATDGAVQKQELNDAQAKSVDADDARRRRGCAILRQQGRARDATAAGC